jgi:hypothetical protein
MEKLFGSLKKVIIFYSKLFSQKSFFMPNISLHRFKKLSVEFVGWLKRLVYMEEL